MTIPCFTLQQTCPLSDQQLEQGADQEEKRQTYFALHPSGTGCRVHFPLGWARPAPTTTTSGGGGISWGRQGPGRLLGHRSPGAGGQRLSCAVGRQSCWGILKPLDPRPHGPPPPQDPAGERELDVPPRPLLLCLRLTPRRVPSFPVGAGSPRTCLPHPRPSSSVASGLLLTFISGKEEHLATPPPRPWSRGARRAPSAGGCQHRSLGGARDPPSPAPTSAAARADFGFGG